MLEDIKESSLEGELLLEGLKMASPKLFKLAQRRPELIPVILEKARGVGILKDSNSAMSSDPYGLK